MLLMKKNYSKNDMEIEEEIFMILNEFDCNKTAVINAFDIIKPIKGFPKIAVTCFARFTFDRLVKELNAIEIASTSIA